MSITALVNVLYHTARNKSRTAGLAAVLGEVCVYASEVVHRTVKFVLCTSEVAFAVIQSLTAFAELPLHKGA